MEAPRFRSRFTSPARCARLCRCVCRVCVQCRSVQEERASSTMEVSSSGRADDRESSGSGFDSRTSIQVRKDAHRGRPVCGDLRGASRTRRHTAARRPGYRRPAMRTAWSKARQGIQCNGCPSLPIRAARSAGSRRLPFAPSGVSPSSSWPLPSRESSLSNDPRRGRRARWVCRAGKQEANTKEGLQHDEHFWNEACRHR
jgi:hypothetical protein